MHVNFSPLPIVDVRTHHLCRLIILLFISVWLIVKQLKNGSWKPNSWRWQKAVCWRSSSGTETRQIQNKYKLTNIIYRKRRTQTSRNTSGLLEKSRTSTWRRTPSQGTAGDSPSLSTRRWEPFRIDIRFFLCDIVVSCHCQLLSTIDISYQTSQLFSKSISF